VAHRIETLPLLSSSPGAARHLKVHRIGVPGARPKAYLQAALHANEIPGLLILHHLLARLLAADAAGQVRGEIVLVPFANPIGLADNVLGNPMGRLSLDKGQNFNRGFFDLAPPLIQRLENRLSGDATENVQTIRSAMLETLAARQPRTEAEQLKTTLLQLSVDSDVVLDLHCEEDALFAIIAGPWCWPALKDLPCDMQPDTVFLSDSPPLFETACSRPWHDLAAHFGPSRPVPQACLAATLELRGVSYVEDKLAKQDADGLFRFLTRRGMVAGDAGPPTPARCEATPFRGVEFVHAPSAGVVVYHEELGSRITKGQVIAEVVDPDADHPSRARVAVRSGSNGILFGKRHTMMVRPDDTIAKIAGAEPLADPKHY
jgi:predicted deacylase